MSNIGRSEETKVKRMNLNVPIEIHNQFKSLTAAEGERMTDVLLRFIKEYVDRHAPVKPKGRRP